MTHKSKLPRWVLAADILAALVAILSTFLLVRAYPTLSVHSRENLSAFDIILYCSFVFLSLSAMAFGGDYRSLKRYSRLVDAFHVLKGTLMCFALMICIAFLVEEFVLQEINDFSRPGIFIMLVTFEFLLITIRLVAHHEQIRAFDSGAWRKKMIIIGAGEQGADLYDHLSRKNWLGVKCIGFVDEHATASPVAEVPLLGKVEDLPTLIAEKDIEEVVIALPPEEHSLMERIVNNGVRKDVKLRIIPDSFAYPYSKLDIQEYDGLAMIDVKQPSLDAMHSGAKRVMDVTLAVFLLILDLPLMIPIFLLVRLTSKGPAIFSQTRMGKDGKPFEMLKFRSMFLGAHEMREELKRKNEAAGAMFKMKEDPRVTGFGRFIRRTSLDELPQLINILKGDMSMVGPRPPLPDEVTRYQKHHLKRLAVRPGVTGLWQVSGRDRRDFEEMARLDLYYIENWSLWLDLKIILKTVPVVLSRRGAY